MAEHYALGHDPRTRMALDAIIILVVVFVVSFAIVACDTTHDLNRQAGETYSEQYHPGQPLDMVKVTAPAWSDRKYMYKMADRTSGACWWRVHMDGEWVTLPVCEGRSYVEQQAEAPVPDGGDG